MLALHLCATVPAEADELVAAHLAALHDSLDTRAAGALDRIEGLGPKLLAARSYRVIFEADNPGYTLFVNPQVRSLDVQLQHWNENRSVADAGNHRLRALHGIVGAGGFPAPGTDEARVRFSQALRAHQPQPTPMLAVPGLSPHGQMHAVDFQVRQDALMVAGPSTAQAETIWLGQGWRDRLESAIRRASNKFLGRLQSPDEPWHYDYRP